MSQRSIRGFSIIEVLIAVVVLSIGILGVLSALLYGFRASSHAERVAEATNYGRQIIEGIRIQNLVFPPPAPSWSETTDSGRRPLNAAPFDAGVTALPNANYRRNIQISYLPPNNTIARIQVRIYWSSSGFEHFVELVGYHGNS